ncbi:hypothetical protein XELAEV_18017483mg [Xenopus laevis]|uniref:NADH dehydrogenase [ubiquinone] 1 alpha subcomplex subunit 12 n=1 Tax=Xenopus laevis TaxID=8355 RepID=A0A974DB95_XENLA|nr:hypothetical protein XELAEV_18017483mg [Xenopus laevis]
MYHRRYGNVKCNGELRGGTYCFYPDAFYRRTLPCTSKGKCRSTCSWYGGRWNRSGLTVGCGALCGSCSARHRWVDYTSEMNGKPTYWEVDGSMVPPEWHRWLHCMTEEPPTTHPPVTHKFVWQNHKFNVSGSPEQYVPFPTTRKKIEEWIPPQPK